MTDTAVRIVDHYIRNADGTVTQIRYLDGVPLWVDPDAPVVFLQSASWILQESFVTPREALLLAAPGA